MYQQNQKQVREREREDIKYDRHRRPKKKAEALLAFTDSWEKHSFLSLIFI